MIRTALPVLAAALMLGGCQQENDAAFGQRVRAYLLANPEVLEETVAALRKKEELAAQKASTAALDKYRAQLERDPRDLVINPNGKITVVEFFDYNCGYCKLVAPQVVKLIEDNPDVRFVFKEYAFQTENSVQAAKIALTSAAKPNGLALYKQLMAQKPLDAAAIDRSLAAAGIDPAAARRAAAHPDIERQLLDVHTLARALRIDGTPAFVVGDRIVPGADIDAVRAAIAEARKRPAGPRAT
jgi:protein-disulfide isomerase